ncbi:type II toxin-antitoxin system RelE/ParE family toxin [Enterobacteriaceae bacterium BIT-l23]|uniref:type II toxin-antitoxin system RelE/ParE family toxin n=1 Tax=Jejubacter sp. L23 TaxID=3092086 RepID=UPI001585236D|nr:type II toxin-antitoxin system RelE/ParE family toxin [Enterobacteriaceae bacterium BIT-l23]
MTVRFTTDARTQIREIRAYSQHRWGRDVASLYAQTLRVTMTDILGRHPSPGRDRSDDLGDGIFSFPCQSHLIYYRETDDGIVIIDVLHHSQDPVRHLPHP